MQRFFQRATHRDHCDITITAGPELYGTGHQNLTDGVGSVIDFQLSGKPAV
jgi:hypothetical protein